jgi:hypothetical protein
MKLANEELKGFIEVLAIRMENGQWEPEWEPLRGTPFGLLFSEVSKEALDHSLKGWSWPLSEALGLQPSGALLKLPKESRRCYNEQHCDLYNANWCFLLAERLPWCFEPAGVFEHSVRKAAARAIEHWREGVYLIVVSE